MESEDDFDMQDANESAEDDDFYSGGDDNAAGPAQAYDSDNDAEVADYEFIDNESDDSDDILSHRHQVIPIFFRFRSFSQLLVLFLFDYCSFSLILCKVEFFLESFSK